MPSVAQLLSAKGSRVWSISPDATVFEGLTLMAEKNIGALLIIEAGQLVGIMSERDYARKIILEGRSSRETPIRSIMSPHLVWVAPNDSIERAMQLMTAQRTRHLPVLDGNALVGLVSIGDLVKATIDHQQHTIDQLERYIAT
jgi:CBS domain-containing protein